MRIATSVLVIFGALSIPLAAPTATAGTNATALHYEHGNANCTNNLRNRAKFWHSNDSVESSDLCADGWGAESETIITETGNTKVCYNGAGNGTTKTCDYNFGEGRLGVIRANSVDNGVAKGSSNYVAFMA